MICLQPAPTFAKKIQSFQDKHFSNKKVIGIHIRYYPKHLIPSAYSKFWLDENKAFEEIEVRIKKAQAQTTGEPILFLCTDSDIVQERLSKQFNNIVTYQKLPEWRDEKQEQSFQLYTDIPDTTLIEMLLLAKCNSLIRYTDSWFSFYASLYTKQI